MPLALEQTSTAGADVLDRGTHALSTNVRAGFNDSNAFELIQRGAKLLSESTLVPKDYQKNLPNCVIALEMAQRIGASPLMIMQNLYIVHGKPAWSSQFLIACVNQCGRFSSLQYEWGGTQGKDDWSCRAWAIDKSTNTRVQGPAISLGQAKSEGWVEKNGSKWKTLPELMLTYRAATFFARTNAPELTMGLQTAEEITDVVNLERAEDGSFGVATVQPARRKSELAAVATETAGPKEAPAAAGGDDIAEAMPTIDAAAAGKPLPRQEVGVVVQVDTHPNGTLVRLDTGFRCATSNAELIKAVNALKGTDTIVEFRTRAPKNPSNARILEEILPAEREAGSDDK
jgi:hypothetical protein